MGQTLQCCSGQDIASVPKNSIPMKHVEVEYFQAHGRAEPIRMLLHHADVKFSNKYVEANDWPTLKNDKKLYPNGGLPVVVIDGKRHFETMASLRSLAIQLGYYNIKNANECYQSDIVCESTSAIYDTLGKILYAPSEDERSAAFKVFNDAIDKLLTLIEESMQVNGWNYAAGDKLSPADFCIAAIYHGFATNSAFQTHDSVLQVFTKHSQLESYLAKLNSALSDYLDKRPTLPF